MPKWFSVSDRTILLWAIFAFLSITAISLCEGKKGVWEKGAAGLPSDVRFDTAHSGIMPEMFPLKEELYGIFQVQEPNCVGTNRLNNAISLIRFAEKNLEYKIVRKDFLRYVDSGDFIYLPVLSDELIGYVQTRGFLLFNMKTTDFSDYLICSRFEKLIGNAIPIDVEDKIFLFEIRDHTGQEIGVEARTLQLMDLKSNPAKMIRSMEICERSTIFTPPWVYQKGTIIVFDEPSGTLQAFNLNFESIPHPLCTLFNKIRPEFRKLDQLYIHPELPFALLVEIDTQKRDNYRTWTASWRDNDNKIFPIKGIYGEIESNHFTFSPKGDWLIYQDETNRTFDDKRAEFIAVPINEKIPYFLGDPINLGKLLRIRAKPISTTWISSPLSFVVTDRKVLYRWNLEDLKKNK